MIFNFLRLWYEKKFCKHDWRQEKIVRVMPEWARFGDVKNKKIIPTAINYLYICNECGEMKIVKL